MAATSISRRIGKSDKKRLGNRQVKRFIRLVFCLIMEFHSMSLQLLVVVESWHFGETGNDLAGVSAKSDSARA